MNKYQEKNRYFIGLSIPEPISSLISRYQTQFIDKDIYMRPIIPHITLVPPNVLNELSLSESLQRLKDINSKLKSFSATLNTINHFNNRVLHIALSDKVGVLRTTHESLIDNLDIQSTVDGHIKQEFTPHITLIQTKPYKQFADQSLKRLIRNTQNYFDLPLKVNFQQIHMFLNKAPRTYEIVHTFQLL
ncbi:2'-5' RNA ligase family protein [Candidatus Saccharibacteria bacterium CPR2]|nr:2'-5' RNA ligase family protein [Candidatus Saccharibacteria bacterium CPR2]